MPVSLMERPAQPRRAQWEQEWLQEAVHWLWEAEPWWVQGQALLEPEAAVRGLPWYREQCMRRCPEHRWWRWREQQQTGGSLQAEAEQG